MRKRLILPIVVNIGLVVFCVQNYLHGIPLGEVLVVFTFSAIVVNLVIRLVRVNAAKTKGEHGGPKL